MNEHTRNEIIHRSLRGQSKREIARELRVSRNTIKAVLEELQEAREGTSVRAEMPPLAKKRASVLDQYEGKLKELLVRYPEMKVVEIQQRLQAIGYSASYTILRMRVKQIRQSASRGDLSTITAPGALAKVTYRDIDIDFADRGICRTKLFILQLVHSRRRYLHLASSKDLASTIYEHIRAFEQFSGTASTIEYDDVPALIVDDAIAESSFNPTFMRFANHYGFRPEDCQIADQGTDGFVERLKSGFLPGHRFRSLDHANDALHVWISNNVQETGNRNDYDSGSQLEENRHLIPLPRHPWRG